MESGASFLQHVAGKLCCGNIKKVLILSLLLVPLFLQAEEIKGYDLEINIKRFYLLINGSSYSDASAIKVELKETKNSKILVCADHNALHSQVIEVMDELRKLGSRNIHFGVNSDCK